MFLLEKKSLSQMHTYLGVSSTEQNGTWLQVNLYRIVHGNSTGREEQGYCMKGRYFEQAKCVLL